MSMGHTRRIRDAVHGYIELDAKLAQIVDLPLFQRLRHIRQGGASHVYPCANHTRFEHSLGVYHLGKRVIDTLIRESKKAVRADFKDRRNTVLAGCLLHDIGHFPLSHTGEKLVTDSEKKSISTKLAAALGVGDPTELLRLHAATHEKLSALLILTDPDIGNILRSAGADPNLAARMVVGLTSPTDSPTIQTIVQICKSSIDVDRLDYLMRDSRMTAPEVVSIDADRLLNAYRHSPNGKLVLDYRCESALLNFMYSRTSLYSYVIHHHRNALAEHLTDLWLGALGARDKDFLGLFSEKGVRSLVDDHDVMARLKSDNNPDNDKFRRVVLYRQDDLKALWKSQTEYEWLTETHINDKNKRPIDKLIDGNWGSAHRQLQSQYPHFPEWHVVTCKPREYGGDDETILLTMRNGQEAPWERVFNSSYRNPYTRTLNSFPYVYVPKTVPESERHQIVDSLFSAPPAPSARRTSSPPPPNASLQSAPP